MSDLNSAVIGLQRKIKDLLTSIQTALGTASTDGNPLKDGTTANKAVVNAANTARTATDNVLLVQTIDSAGNIGGGSSGIAKQPVWSSPYDFTATYTSASTITISACPFNVDDSICTVLSIAYQPAAKTSISILVNGQNGISMTATNNLITIYENGVAYTGFVAGDIYMITIDYQNKAYDPIINANTTAVVNPAWSNYLTEELLNTTNIAAATNYYPATTGGSLDGYKHLSMTGSMVDADAVDDIISLEVTNDVTGTVWYTAHGYDVINDTNVDILTRSGAGTLNYAVKYDNLVFNRFRIKHVTGGSTNTEIIRIKRSY